MIFKKMFCVFMVVLTVFCCLPLSSFAAGENIRMTQSFSPEYRLAVPDCSDTQTVLSGYVNIDEFKTLLLDTVANVRVVTDISEYNFPVTVHSEINELIFYGIPEAFNVYEIGYSYAGSKLLMIHLSFRDFADTPEEYAECFGKMKKNADRLLAGIENNSSLSDENKALLLHDRLCVHNEYTYYAEITDVEHTAYGALATRSSVCQGYAMAYMYLLNRVGIKNYYCSSGVLNHAWNIVYIDGKAYHVDVTFDDISWESPELRNVPGALRHDYFLRSTKSFKAQNHNANDFDSTPTDIKYDNYYWQVSDSEFQLVGNKIYYIDNENEALKCVGVNEALVSVKDVWKADGNSHWVGNFSRLSSAGGELFFSLSDSIYKYTVTTGESEKIYSPYLHDKFSIYGFTYEDGKLIYDVNTAPPGGNFTYLKRETADYSEITHIMNKLEVKFNGDYYIGDSLDYSDFVVTAYFTDNTSERINDGFSFSGFDSSSPGKKTVVVRYNGFKAECTAEIKTPSIILEKNIDVKQDETKTLTVKTLPTGQKITWKSTSSSVQIKDGKVTGMNPGVADITAEFTYNGKVYGAVCKVNVSCAHKNTEVHKEIPATTEKVGFTEGIYCNVCKKYISGHKEIPVIDMTFKESDTVFCDGEYVWSVAGKTVREFFLIVPSNSVVVDANGKAVPDGSFIATGMILVLPDNSRVTVVVQGDVNSDSKITAADARLALRASVGLEKYEASSPQYKAADVDEISKLSASDARLILRVSVGLDNNLLWLDRITNK